MKQKIIETGKCRVLCLDFPIGKNDWISNTQNLNHPDGNWKILGFYKELLDEQKEMIVDRIAVEEIPSPHNDMGGGMHYAWTDYENLGPFQQAGWQGDSGCFNEISESFFSLLKANDIFLENPLGDGSHLDADMWTEHIEYEEAEQNVYRNLFILIEPKN